MNFMLSTDAVVCCALAAIFIFFDRTSARPAPYTMYTPPVPPVTMLSVRPSKFGVADAAADGVAVAVARGAEQAVAIRSPTRSGARDRTERPISIPPERGQSKPGGCV